MYEPRAPPTTGARAEGVERRRAWHARPAARDSRAVRQRHAPPRVYEPRARPTTRGGRPRTASRGLLHSWRAPDTPMLRAGNCASSGIVPCHGEAARQGRALRRSACRECGVRGRVCDGVQCVLVHGAVSLVRPHGRLRTPRTGGCGEVGLLSCAAVERCVAPCVHGRRLCSCRAATRGVTPGLRARARPSSCSPLCTRSAHHRALVLADYARGRTRSLPPPVVEAVHRAPSSRRGLRDQHAPCSSSQRLLCTRTRPHSGRRMLRGDAFRRGGRCEYV